MVRRGVKGYAAKTKAESARQLIKLGRGGRQLLAVSAGTAQLAIRSCALKNIYLP
jgi:hypothetical protein